MRVSDEQQRNSAIHIHVSILPQTALPSWLPHNIEQTSLCCPAGPCGFSMLNTAVCPCPSQTPCLSLPPSFPLVTIRLLQSTEQSFLGCPAGPCWFSMLNTAACPCPSQTPGPSFPPPTISSSFSKSVSLSVFCKLFCVTSLQTPHMRDVV